MDAVPEDTPLGGTFWENAATIYRFIYAKVGNREAAEDLTSQVFLKAVRWPVQDRSADSIRAWLYTVARGTIADYWREQSQHPTVPLDDPDAVLFCGREGPEEVRRTRERAWRILEALPEREVLRLRFLHGYTAVEIGQALGLTPGNVRVLQLRALRRSATHLDPEAGVRGEATVEETGPMDDRQMAGGINAAVGVLCRMLTRPTTVERRGSLQESTRMFCSA